MERIALAQINIDYENTEINVDKSFILIQQAIQNRCDLIIFPELWSSGFKLGKCPLIYERNVLLFNDLQNISTNNNIEIIGSYINRIGDNYYNQFVCFHPGTSYSHYEKINLFPALQETKYLLNGNHTVVLPTKIGQVGASICFDLRFPSIYKEERTYGAEVFIIPAHWPMERILHWDILLQARAVENFAYVIGVNSVGKSGKILFGGHSTVISPDGNKIFQADGKYEGVHFVEIDREQVIQTRGKYSYMQK